MRENRFGSAALKGIFKKNSVKSADPLQPDKFSIGIPVAPDSNEIRGTVQYGQMLPTRIEKNLPPYPNDFKPTDGSWQVNER